ncbi:hypothetical protein Slin14017_G042170 [Septoria linicola]|nr:hypothetical protein Slin14017_G042170 [Septoria linicola]
MHKILVLASSFYVAGQAAATTITSRQEGPSLFAPSTLVGIGPGKVLNTQAGDENAQEEFFATAGHNLDLTTSVTFQYGTGGTANDDNTWTWRVNIANVNLSPLTKTATYPTFVKGKAATNLQFDLQWPGGGPLTSQLEHQAFESGFGNPLAPQTDTSLCASRLSYEMPANITSRSSASDNGNCSSVLGE